MSEMITPIRVAAVFACYNRRETALKCVRRLREQSRLPDLVIVADNASQDGSVEALCALNWDRLRVVETGDNLGNAGGVRVAMEEAFASGADAVWILDDDSWPRTDALEHLLEGFWDPKTVRHSIQVDPVSGRFTWPLLVEDGKGGWRFAWTADEMAAPLQRSRTAWTGALVSRQVREAVGPVMSELFIRGEDEEYPWRIAQAGFHNLAVAASILDHPGPHAVVHWQFLGRSLFLERGLDDWKLHYKVRNMVWLKRRQSGSLGALAMALAYAVGIAMVDGVHRLPLIWKAFSAGWHGKLGRLDAQKVAPREIS